MDGHHLASQPWWLNRAAGFALDDIKK